MTLPNVIYATMKLGVAAGRAQRSDRFGRW